MLMKFGTPILTATRTESLPARPDGYLMQIPGAATAAATVATVTAAAKAGAPVLLSGRADTIHPELLKLAGAKLSAGGAVTGGWTAKAVPASLSLSRPDCLLKQNGRGNPCIGW